MHINCPLNLDLRGGLLSQNPPSFLRGGQWQKPVDHLCHIKLLSYSEEYIVMWIVKWLVSAITRPQK